MNHTELQKKTVTFSDDLLSIWTTFCFKVPRLQPRGWVTACWWAENMKGSSDESSAKRAYPVFVAQVGKKINKINVSC